MILHALKILRFRSLSFLLSVGVVVLLLSSLQDARTLWLKFLRSSHSHPHVSCARDELINLKKKAGRPVRRRRQWVMIER